MSFSTQYNNYFTQTRHNKILRSDWYASFARAIIAQLHLEGFFVVNLEENSGHHLLKLWLFLSANFVIVMTRD